jgi:hypothetical protein
MESGSLRYVILNRFVQQLTGRQATTQPAVPLGVGGGYYRDRLEGTGMFTHPHPISLTDI